MDGPQGSRETPTIQVPEVLAMDVSERVIGGRTVRVSACGADGAPTVYASMYEDVGDRVLEGCRGLGCPPFNLVSVSGLDWDSDLSPWQCGPSYPETTTSPAAPGSTWACWRVR